MVASVVVGCAVAVVGPRAAAPTTVRFFFRGTIARGFAFLETVGVVAVVFVVVVVIACAVAIATTPTPTTVTVARGVR